MERFIKYGVRGDLSVDLPHISDGRLPLMWITSYAAVARHEWDQETPEMRVTSVFAHTVMDLLSELRGAGWLFDSPRDRHNVAAR